MTLETKPLSLKDYDISPERGMLADPDPGEVLPTKFWNMWGVMAQQIPRIISENYVALFIKSMPILDAYKLDDSCLPTAMRALSFLGHTAVLHNPLKPKNRIPAPIAIPWHQVAKRLGRPPVLSYATYVLDNWRCIDPKGPIALGNIALIQRFTKIPDEEWFILVHIKIEEQAHAVFLGIEHAFSAMARDEASEVDCGLQTIAGGIEQMYETLLRMPEHCDPATYYHQVRPYLFGWKDNPALPDGVIYEGVKEYGGKPQQFRGETGAQSGIIPALDAALGICFRDDPLLPYLYDMRNYMPPRHRAFITALEEHPRLLRNYVINKQQSHPSLRDAYNACITLVEMFRAKHLEYAWEYIFKWAKQGASVANPTDRGTGGTLFMEYLRKHLQETHDHLL